MLICLVIQQFIQHAKPDALALLTITGATIITATTTAAAAILQKQQDQH